MRRLVLTSLALAVAALTNTASVVLQQRGRYLTRWFGRRGWYIHLTLVLPFWAAFLATLPGAGDRLRWPLPRRLSGFGTLLLGAVAVLWLASYRQLGGTRTGNGNIFGHGSPARLRSGVFRVRPNPMYDSYVLALIGIALRRRNAAYLLLAVEAALLCYGMEAHAENRFLPDSTHPYRTIAGRHCSSSRRSANNEVESVVFPSLTEGATRARRRGGSGRWALDCLPRAPR